MKTPVQRPRRAFFDLSRPFVLTEKAQSTLYRLAVFSVMVFTVVTRLAYLGEKPLHHDESLFGFYSWKFFTGAGYNYIPLLHGPLLLFLNALMYMLFGDSEFTARLVPALCGIGLVGLVLSLKKYLGRPGALAAGILLALSPTTMYYSRFLRHDVLFLFLLTLMFTMLLLYREKRKDRYLYLCVLLGALLYSTKETSLFIAFTLATFPIFRLCVMLAVSGDARKQFVSFAKNEDLQKKTQSFLKRNEDRIIYSMLIVTGTVVLLYTTFLQNFPDGLFDGLYRKSIPYWLEQHRIQRIRGPFWYYGAFLMLYEMPSCFIVVTSLLYLFVKRWYAWLGIVLWVALAFGLALLPPFGIEEWLETMFHMWSVFDVFLAVSILIIGLYLAVRFIKISDTLTSFLVYWTTVSMLVYAYAGEKVPWLLLYILFPLVLLGARLMNYVTGHCGCRKHGTEATRPLFRRITYWGLILLLAWSLSSSLRLTFLMPADPAELLVYVHTSQDIPEMKRTIDTVYGDRLDEKSTRGPGVVGTSVWPLTWYLRNVPKRAFYRADDASWKEKEHPVIILDGDSPELQTLSPHDYLIWRYTLRQWWQPDFSHLTMEKSLRYIFKREIFSPKGGVSVALCVDKAWLRGKNRPPPAEEETYYNPFFER